MRIFYRLAGLFRSLFQSDRVDADLADEMRFHVERETEANIARGMHPDAARRSARLKFGSVAASHEQSRDERPGVGIRQALQDIRFGARLLGKSPVFGLTAVAIIALGIGAATAIFGVVYGVMLRPLPFHEPERLVSILMSRGQSQVYPTAADAADLRQLRRVFTDVALVRTANANLNLIGDGEPQRLQSARVSPNLFSVLGVSPIVGRAFSADEDQPGRERVVLLSEALWRSRFGGNREIVGRPINLDGTPYTVIGVMPAAFQYPTTSLDAWITAVLEPGELARTSINNYRLVARLDPRVSLDQARREAAALAVRLGSSLYWGHKDATFTVESMLDDAVRAVRPTLGLLLGAVSFLLLIACVNLSNLFGARAIARSGEFAVRLALGASRARLIAQAIAEATPILVAGGVGGILVAKWAVQAFAANAPAGLPRVESITLSAPVVFCSFVVLVVTGLAASIAPAVQAWRSDFGTITKEASRSSTSGRGREVSRRVGVAVQVAFALPLLVGASLLIQSAMQVARVNVGFKTDRVATLAFEPSRTKHATEQALGDYYTRLVEAVRSVPGVASAAVVNRIPLVGAQTNTISFEHSHGDEAKEFYIDSRTVTGEYFATLGIPLLAGRTFTANDDLSAPRVAIVDDQIARQMWPGEQAVGKRFRIADNVLTVVGVVGHVRTSGVEVDPRPQVYWTVRQWPQIRAVLAVRSELDTKTLFPAVIKAVRSVDPDQSFFDLRTMQDIVDRSLAQRRVTTLLMIGFGAIALLLAAVGIYGVVAYGVTQRFREFGIRVALGATRNEVTRLVVWQGTSMAVVGASVGLALAVAMAGTMRSLVFGVAPRDALSIVAATTILLIVAALASYFPARRAAAVDPAVTLRSE